MAQEHPSANDNTQNDAGTSKKKPTSAYRKFRRQFAKTRLRAPLVWLNHRNLSPADVFISSYPKSGSTWARFVLFEMFSGMPARFKTINELMTRVGKHANGLRMLPGGGRLIGTHEQYRRDYHRAICVVRDARDVLLSEFAYLKALDYFHGDLDEFISTFLFTCGSAYGYGPWHRHVSSWLDSPIAETENLLLVRYEDLRQDPVPWFVRMAEFLKLDVDREKIELAVANNSLQKMREKERKEPVRVSIRGSFVRKGSVRGWVSELSPAQVRLVEQHTGSALLRLGYQLSSQLNPEAAEDPVVIHQAR